jgi:adenylate cyclase
LISRALAIDSNNYFAHYAKSSYLAAQRQDEAIVEAERTLALNPSFLPAYISLWIANWTAGRTEKADQYDDEALRLGPHDSLAVVFLGEKGDGLFIRSRYEEATEFFKRAIAVAPEAVQPSFKLAASLALSGHDAEAREALRALSRAAAQHSEDDRPIQGAPAIRHSQFAQLLRTPLRRPA